MIHYVILLFVALNLLGKFAVGVDGFGQITYLINISLLLSDKETTKNIFFLGLSKNMLIPCDFQIIFVSRIMVIIDY